MDALPKGQVAIWVAPNIKGVGMQKLIVVTVGTTQHDANRIAYEKRGEGWPYQWVGIFDNQDEMDHFQQWHPPEAGYES